MLFLDHQQWTRLFIHIVLLEQVIRNQDWWGSPQSVAGGEFVCRLFIKTVTHLYVLNHDATNANTRKLLNLTTRHNKQGQIES